MLKGIPLQLVIAALCLGIGCPVVAQVTVVDVEQTWRWRIPESDPGTSWKEFEFDDAGWATGQALLGFETDAVVEPGLKTVIGLPSTPPMVYLFRTEFHYTGTTDGCYFSLDHIVDDGVTYYINGVRVGSWNHTPGAWNNGADSGVSNAAHHYGVLSGPLAGLRAGRNVLAAEVHQVSVNGSDLIFGARLRIYPPTQNSADWKQQHLGSSFASDTADPDQDGLASMLEFALGTNPRTGRGGWSSVKTNAAGLHVTFTRSKAALAEMNIVCLGSTSPGGPWSSAGVNETVHFEDDNIQRVTASLATTGNSPRFFRLQAQRKNQPLPPSGLTALTYASDQVDLAWVDHASDETGYVVERRETGGSFSTIAVLSPNAATYRDTGRVPGTTYFYRVRASGASVSSVFSREGSVTPDYITITRGVPLPAPINEPSTMQAQVPGSAASYSWNFGDGTSGTSTTGVIQHTYQTPGHYQVIVTATRADESASTSFLQTVHYPLHSTRPTHSSPIILDEGRKRVWNVNPDTNTVSAIDYEPASPDHYTKLWEVPVAQHPRTLAQAPDGTIWVVNQNSASISVLARDTGTLLATITLPRASRPHGIAFSPDGTAAFVSLEGSGNLLRLDPTTRSITGQLPIGPTPRAIAVSHDSQRIFVTRLISKADRGQVTEVDAVNFTVVRTFDLMQDTTTIETETAGRGVPNYLTGIAIAPDGRRAWIPAKKDNTLRGGFRDGKALGFDSTVRTITTVLDLVNNTEVPAARIDYNDRDSASAVVFNPLGNYAFVALQGSNSIAVRDAYDHKSVSAAESTGLAPQGLAITADGTRLFAHNFMSRTVRVYDTSALVNSTSFALPAIATIPVVANELLSPEILHGKKIFYNAKDPRMNRDGYISCASCHLDGGHDGRVWDFTDRGEGLRNTTTLIGRAGMGHGRVHWSGNFDEIQDFENDIRNNFGGTGFMTNAQYTTGTRSQTLGDPKAGISPDLDALAAYVSSLATVESSPYRNTSGGLTPDGGAGKQIFQELACASCHSGPHFTDSASGVLHNVGTIQSSSGKRLGQSLTGLDTPTLKGLWATAPYFHDGSAPTIDAALAHAATDPTHRHGNISSLTPTQRSQLAAYLLQIDETVD